ncbi:cytochrome b [Candidatus Methylospira mobilis]|uniref:Cytochrome b n=1 Tax=Candidatus Methylospira mobilis TaxID=1808979 RepID=A0A5Q0BIU1_9GAMM|nr:cytochrome b [Candidatus Methylospira mobilis]QFY41746.1 cytochrome b [Candidatus Methylospira mobilis]WNV06603.1 cytochrome b [Candidatus Methylospira mobilis]
MAFGNTIRYNPTAQWLHWLMAVLIIGTRVLGYYFEDLPRGPERSSLIGWHKATGSTVLPAVAFRLAWRSFNPPPPLSATMPLLLRKITGYAFIVYYLLMILVPLAGWAESNAFGYPVKLAGVLPLPVLLEKNESLGEAFRNVHVTLAWAFGILIAGHAAAALKHHFVDRDDTLARMLPNHGKKQK